jgi:uncharacterized RDD family membrane protein YckC
LATCALAGHVYGAMTRAYAALGRRLSAYCVDAIVVTGGIVVIAMIGDFARNVPGSGRVLVVLLYALIFLYEPISVWRFGATIGQRATNLRVVDDATDGNPSFWRAALRFVLKVVLGSLSLLAMGFTRRHQALHDRLTDTTVQIRDMSRALPGDYHPERVMDATVPGMPSAFRRLAIVVLYSVVLFFAGIVEVALIIVMFGKKNTTLMSNIFVIAWLAATLMVAIAGWRGLLIGARRRVPDSIEE